MKSNDNIESEIDIKKELISDELSELLKSLIIFLLMAALFGYIGYSYSKYNNTSISHGIIFGIFFPFGVGLLEEFDCNNLFCFIIYTIAYLLIVSYIPTFIGVIILFIMIALFIANFIYIEKKDRTKEIEEYYKSNKCNKENDMTIVQNNSKTVESLINKYSTEKVTEDLIDNDNDTFYADEEEFECEMCFKKISEEEYELYDCMCEDCFMDVHTDKDGNFHDENVL